MRICANKVVAGARPSSLVRKICSQDSNKFARAHQIHQLEGLAVAIPWGSSPPFRTIRLACLAREPQARSWQASEP